MSETDLASSSNHPGVAADVDCSGWDLGGRRGPLGCINIPPYYYSYDRDDVCDKAVAPY